MVARLHNVIEPGKRLADEVNAAARDDTLCEDMLLKHLVHSQSGEVGTFKLRGASSLSVCRDCGWAKSVRTVTVD
eukprot:2994308-Amphidinium_carterae.1